MFMLTVRLSSRPVMSRQQIDKQTAVFLAIPLLTPIPVSSSPASCDPFSNT